MEVTSGGTVKLADEGLEPSIGPVEKVCFPPAANWYKTNGTAARDNMWAYVASQSIVLVKPKTTFPNMRSEQLSTCKNGTSSSLDTNGSADVPKSVVAEAKRDVWPSFEIFGYQKDPYICLSFCQSGWELLPVKDSPLVTGCKEGYVRIWNAATRKCVMFHDLHKEERNVSISCVDWSVRNPKVIYSMDEEGTLISWHVGKMKLKAFSFGKITPSSLQASPHADNIVAFGTKGGTIFILQTDPAGKGSIKILHKVRHDEEIVATLWCPMLDWRINKNERNMEDEASGTILASSIQSTKSPTIRLWSGKAEDRGMYQVWRKEAGPGGKIFRNFSPLLWATDPNTGDPLLVTSSKRGEILSYTRDSALSDLVHDVHSHVSIFGLVQCGDIIWSTSYEPVIVGWDLRKMAVSCVIPTFKGICSIAPSPSYGGFIGVGGTDAFIRVMDFTEEYPNKAASKAPLLTIRMRSKIMALAWHPEKDTLLGFGTDDGVLGVYEVRDNNKYVLQFDRRVDGVVYAVDWGPPVSYRDSIGAALDATEGSLRSTFNLYACGGNSVYFIHPSKKDNPLINASKIISSTNFNSTRLSGLSGGSTIPSKASDIRWSPDFSLFAVGYNDGRVELYSPPFLQLKCWIKCHARAIQYLSWRSYDVIHSKNAPDHKERWFVTTSNDGTARLFNLEGIFDESFLSDEEQKPKLIITSAATFRSPNGERIIACTWSPHDPNLMVTVSYDSTGIVWNIEDGSPVARYFGHGHRLVACCFHPKDKHKIITASDESMYDCTLQVWDYRDHPYSDTLPVSKRCADENKPLHIKSEGQAGADDVIEEKSLPEKNLRKDAASHLHVVDETVADKFVSHDSTKKKSKNKTNKSKSLLPATANVFINSKLSLDCEIKYLVKRAKDEKMSNGVSNGGDESVKSENSGDRSLIHLGLLGDNVECVELMKAECESHEQKEEWEKGCLLAFWMGDTEFIERAVKSGHVTETIINLASSMSRRIYLQACEAYAEKLILEDEITKAATYLLQAGLKGRAINLLIDHKLFRDAVALMKICMNKKSSIQVETMKAWLVSLVQDGNFELAAKIYCSIGMLDDALAVVTKRDTPLAWKAGMYLASETGNLNKLEFLGLKYCLHAMMKADYEEAQNAVLFYGGLKWLLPLVTTHQVIFNLSNAIRDAGSTCRNSGAGSDLQNIIKEQLDLHGLKPADVITKLKQTILIQIAQNSTDAEMILLRTLVLAVLRDSELDMLAAKENCVKLSNTWLKEKYPFMHAAYSAVIMQNILSP